MSRRGLNVDWSMIQALYMQGVAPMDLAAKFNVKPATLTARIFRGRWGDQREECRSLAKAALTPATVTDVQSVSTKFRSWFERDIQRVMDRLDKLPVETMPVRELEQRHGVVKGIYTIASEMFDWTGEAAKNPINSQLLGRLLDEVESIREGKVQSITVAPIETPAGEGSSEPVQAVEIPPAVQPGEESTALPSPVDPPAAQEQSEENNI